MATVVNDRDVLIMSTTPRYTPPTNRGMFVTPPAGVFKLSPDGLTASPSSFTFTATLLNMTGTVTWSTTGGISLSINGNDATLSFASFTAMSGTITASITVDGQPFTAIATVTKVADGATGQNGVRGTINISAATGGTIWSDSDANAAIASAGYATHQTRDVVTLYNQSAKFSKTKFWDGSAWQDVAQVLDGNLLVQGSVNSQSLATGAVTASSVAVSSMPDNILPDPRFKDLSWWGFNGSQASAADWIGQAVGWSNSASCYIYPCAYTEYRSKRFPISRGGTYRMEIQVNVPSTFAGQFSVYLYLPGSNIWIGMGQQELYDWQQNSYTNVNVMYDSNSARALYSSALAYTIPDVSGNDLAQLVIFAKVDAGYVEIGGFSLARVTDTVLLKDGAVTATKIAVVQLDAVAARIGTLRTATSGARTEIGDNIIKMFADNNQKILHLGDSTK